MRKSRLPAVVATAVAVPVAVAAGIVAFNVFAPAADDSRFEQDLSPVTVAVPELTDEQAVVCLAVTATAPAELADLPSRPVEGGRHASEFVLAYGDPAVVATCGAEPVEVEDTAAVFRLNGVCWFSEEDGGGSEWVTVDRRVPVGVAVPGDHQAADLLNELSVVLEQKVPAAEDAPTGCS
ncbi:DUF3515 family protein [Glycomyces xiaoerkulensis]|uniref:DUF3515 family protein n=1 Tax=Glycomyces xiaoerkulensis TaxID=2038139 RepID=UPI0013000886|nr:DUF3515 family protein [Glycomyces xiaoerkulensis]